VKKAGSSSETNVRRNVFTCAACDGERLPQRARARLSQHDHPRFDGFGPHWHLNRPCDPQALRENRNSGMSIGSRACLKQGGLLEGCSPACVSNFNSRPPAIRNADAFNRPRRSMSGLSPAGTEVAQECARALQKRSDNNGCAARLSPQTLLFATQSLARLYSIADDSQENACRLHPSAKASLGQWACRGCPWPVIGG
jgi:hypothetical protein